MSAFVDIKTGKIIGAKKGSLTWFHEQGHIIYNKTEQGMRNDFRRQSFFNATVLFLVLSLFHWFFQYCAVFSIILTILFAAYEESWCWSYALRKKKEVKFKK